MQTEAHNLHEGLNGYSDSAPVAKVLISSVTAAADYNKAYTCDDTNNYVYIKWLLWLVSHFD